MKINWKIRFQNRTWLAALMALAVSFVFDLLALLDVVPVVTESMAMQLGNMVLTVLCAVGVVSDPTTPGAADSERAMRYVAPGTTEENG